MNVCLVVQRYGRSIVGGSEALARIYAAILRERHEVEVATTTARDTDWRDELPSGSREEEGVLVHRFAPDFERSAYWHALHGLMLEGIDTAGFTRSAPQKDLLERRLARWSAALQEEVIRRQGPYPSGLLDFLAAEGRRFDRVLFLTSIYPTAYFGSLRVERQRALLVPTLHDEPIAYLPVYRGLFRRVRTCLFLTRAERALARRLYGPAVGGPVAGMPVAATAEPDGDGVRRGRGDAAPRYLLFAGRLDAGKGADRLIRDFELFKSRHGGELELRLIGERAIEIPDRPDVRYEGWVDERSKSRLLAGALLFVHPSPFESLGIVLLESFAAGVPALVNAGSDVLVEHCRRSGGGLWYRTGEEFAEALRYLLEHEDVRERMGRSARDYVRATYGAAAVAERLERALVEERGPEDAAGDEPGQGEPGGEEPGWGEPGADRSGGEESGRDDAGAEERRAAEPGA